MSVLLVISVIALFALLGLVALVIVLALWLTGRKGPGDRDDYSASGKP